MSKQKHTNQCIIDPKIDNLFKKKIKFELPKQVKPPKEK